MNRIELQQIARDAVRQDEERVEREKKMADKVGSFVLETFLCVWGWMAIAIITLSLVLLLKLVWRAL